MAYKNTWETAGLYRTFSGEINGDEILEANFELHSHPNFASIKYIINDFLGVTGHSIKVSHTNAYAVSDEVISSSKGRLKIALVVNQEALIALANGYRELMMGKLFECEIFSTVEEARKWVNNE